MNDQLVVFDIAGTTVVDKGDINIAFRSAFENADLSVTSGDVDLVMGYEKMQAIQILNEKYHFGLSENGIKNIHAAFINEMVLFYQTNEIEPQPFALEIFEWLQSQQIKVALNTGFNRKITDAVLDNLQWKQHPFINTVVCSDEVDSGRPAPFMIQKIMKQLNISDSKKVIKVGDTEVDIHEGKNAHCGLVIGITTGAYSKTELLKYHPDFIIDSLLELKEIIQTK